MAFQNSIMKVRQKYVLYKNVRERKPVIVSFPLWKYLYRISLMRLNLRKINQQNSLEILTVV